MAAADPVVLVLQVEGDGEGEGRKGRPAAKGREEEWLSLLAWPGRVEGVITGTPALASRPCKDGIDKSINLLDTFAEIRVATFWNRVGYPGYLLPG